jgi:hypothetical protein
MGGGPSSPSPRRPRRLSHPQFKLHLADGHQRGNAVQELVNLPPLAPPRPRSLLCCTHAPKLAVLHPCCDLGDLGVDLVAIWVKLLSVWG